MPCNLIDINVQRNAFGRQKESFEQVISIDGIADHFPAVFIRAPVILDSWGDCKTLSKIDDKIVMVRCGNILALSFHPELTDDLRVHRYFIKIVEQMIKK